LRFVLPFHPLLQQPQPGIQAFAPQQFCVVAAFDDATLVHHEDFVRGHDARKPMGDNQCASIFRQTIEFLLDGLL
jgi:hypothetical protein